MGRKLLDDRLRDLEMGVYRDSEWKGRYYRVYLEFLEGVFMGMSGVDYRLLFTLCGIMQWNSGFVDLREGKWSEMVGVMGVSKNTFYKRLRSLVDQGVVIREDKGMYHINPNFVWYGEDRNRNWKIEALKKHVQDGRIRVGQGGSVMESVDDWQADGIYGQAGVVDDSGSE